MGGPVDPGTGRPAGHRAAPGFEGKPVAESNAKATKLEGA